MTSKSKIIDLTTNVSQIYTEIYRFYSIISNPVVNVFEKSLYFENIQSSSIKTRMNNELIKFHKKEGTLDLYINPDKELKDQAFTVGCGSTHLYKGLIYAIGTTFPDRKFLIVQKIPYFSGHASAVSLFPYTNLKYQGYNDPSEIVHSPDYTIVEFVTSPNNPDGSFRQPETNPDVIIGDFVFTSSGFGPKGNGYIKKNLKWLKQARDKNICVFSYNSASKQFGKTGDRIGYMWFPLYHEFAFKIYNQFNNFIGVTVGVDIHGISEFLDLLPFLKKKMRKIANHGLKKRFKLVSNAIIERYPGSVNVTTPGSPTLFIKINDSRIVPGKVSASDIIFSDTNVKTINGSVFGATDSYVRINLMAFSEDLQKFINRLLKGHKIHKKKLLRLPRHSCENKSNIIYNNYTVNPDDKLIKIDASNNDITVYLVKFLGYEPSLNVLIKRIDESDNKVRISSETFSLTIDKGEDVVVNWRQPYYQNGKWHLVSSVENIETKSIEEDEVTSVTCKDLSHLFIV